MGVVTAVVVMLALCAILSAQDQAPALDSCQAMEAENLALKELVVELTAQLTTLRTQTDTQTLATMKADYERRLPDTLAGGDDHQFDWSQRQFVRRKEGG